MKNKKVIIMIFTMILIIVVFFAFKDKMLKMIYPKAYQEPVLEYATKYQVNENLIFAVIKAESNFDEKAISNREAVGLMQIMEETAKDVARKNDIDLNAENLRDEVLQSSKNIEIGTCYLKTLLDRYENEEVALAAYNAGIGTVDRLARKRDY